MNEDAKVVAVGGSDEGRAKAFASEHGVPKAYGSYDAVIQDPEVEVVYVATLHPYHREAMEKASAAGKAVLCEKPLALNAKDAEAMVEAARKNKTYFQEAMWTRYYPATNDLRALLKEGRIGEVISLDAKLGFLAPPNTTRLTQKSAGASALLDVGIYVLTYASMVFGPEAPAQIVSVGKTIGEGSEAFDTHFVTTLKYPNGGIAILEGTFEAAPECKAVITGTKGRITIPNFWCPTEYTVVVHSDAPAPGGAPGVASSTSTTYDASTNPSYALPSIPGHHFNFNNSQGLAHEARYLHDALNRGLLESELESLDESLTIMRTIDTIAKQIGFSNY